MSHEDMLSAIKEEYLGKLNDALIDQYRNATTHRSENVAEWIDEFTKKNALDDLFSGTP
jgi:hypothetical protein